MIKNKIPIAVFVYNRPNHTNRMLASLEACYRLDECRVVIHSDAPNISEHVPDVQAVRTLIKKWAVHHHAEVVEQQENLGVDRSIVSGVSELCNQFGRFIAIEDDLVLHPVFIHYMLESLNRYQDDERVALVSGYIFPNEATHKFDTLFLPLTSAWGWASWERAWDLFDWDAPGALNALRDDKLRHRFDLNGAYPYSHLLIDTLAKKDHRPWDILFYWAVFSSNKLGLHPAQSLVHNEGFDGSGIHFTKKWTGYNSRAKIVVTWAADHEFTWPPEVRSDEQTLQSIEYFLSSSPSAYPSNLGGRLKYWASALRIFGSERYRNMYVSKKKLRDKLFSWFVRQMDDFKNDREFIATIPSTSRVHHQGAIENLSFNPANISLGNNTQILGRLLTFAAGKIQIGDWCYVGHLTEIWSLESVFIGNRVFISHGVNIQDSTAHSIDPLERHEHYRRISQEGHPPNRKDLPGVHSAPIIIEDDVWISFGVIILKGVRIGAGSIIAAGSIVTKDIPPHVLYRNEVTPVITPL